MEPLGALQNRSLTELASLSLSEEHLSPPNHNSANLHSNAEPSSSVVQDKIEPDHPEVQDPDENDPLPKVSSRSFAASESRNTHREKEGEEETGVVERKVGPTSEHQDQSFAESSANGNDKGKGKAIEENGNLHLQTPSTDTRLHLPRGYQEQSFGFTASCLIDEFARPRKLRAHTESDLNFTVRLQSTIETVHSIASQYRISYDEIYAWRNRQEHVWLHAYQVTSSKRFVDSHGRSGMQLTGCAGPQPDQGRASSQFQWFVSRTNALIMQDNTKTEVNVTIYARHLQRDTMDLGHFREEVLKAPGLSAEFIYLVLQLFERIENTYRTRLFDGYQVEPGTVLRCNGDAASDPGNAYPSVTFICLPYLTFRGLHSSIDNKDQQYPTKTMLQTLYPYESSTGRDSLASFCKDSVESSRGTVYVAHLWLVTIQSGNFVITCSECDFNSLRGQTVKLSNTADLHNGENDSAKKDVQERPRSSVIRSPPSMPQPHAHVTTDAAVKQGLRNTHNPIRSHNQRSSSCYKSFLPEAYRGAIDGPSPLRGSVIDDCGQLQPFPDGQRVSGRTHMSTESGDTRTENLSQTQELERPTDVRMRFRRHLMRSKDHYGPFLMSIAYAAEPIGEDEYFSHFLKNLKAFLELQQLPTPEYRNRYRWTIEDLVARTITAEFLDAAEQLGNQDYSSTHQIDYRNLATMETLNAEISLASRRFATSIKAALRLLADILNYKFNFLPRDDIVGLDEDEAMTENADLTPILLLGHSTAGTTWDTGFGRMRSEYLFSIFEDIERSICYRKPHVLALIREKEPENLERVLYKRTAKLRAANHGLRSRDHASSKTPPAAGLQSNIDAASSKTPNEILRTVSDEVLATQSNEMISVTRAMVNTFKVYLAQFIPQLIPRFKHRLLRKIWGAFCTMLQNRKAKREKVKDSDSAGYTIRLRPTIVLEPSKIQYPHPALEECASCRTFFVYMSIKDALDHLIFHHFQKVQMREEVEFVSYNWICTPSQLRTELRNEEHIALLGRCLSNLKVLCKRGKEIRAIAARNKERTARDITISTLLMKCFEETVLFVFQATITDIAISDGERYVPGMSILIDDEQQTQNTRLLLDELAAIGQAAKTFMTRAQKLLKRPDMPAGYKNVAPTSPEYLVGLIFQNLQDRQLLPSSELGLNGLYQQYITRLRYQVHRFPRKRLLPDIHFLQDELTVVEQVNQWQSMATANLLELFEMESHTPGAANSTPNFLAERRCLRIGLRALETQLAEIEALNKCADTLREELKESVEILEEDHGKAIIVFTTITTVFLPLSFVASFFGMNTADIRNTNHQQAFFWVIAVPVTFGVVGIAIFLAYRGGKLYDAATVTFHRFRENSRSEKTESTHIGHEMPRMIDSKSGTYSRGFSKKFPFLRKRPRTNTSLLPYAANQLVLPTAWPHRNQPDNSGPSRAPQTSS